MSVEISTLTVYRNYVVHNYYMMHSHLSSSHYIMLISSTAAGSQLEVTVFDMQHMAHVYTLKYVPDFYTLTY